MKAGMKTSTRSLKWVSRVAPWLAGLAVSSAAMAARAVEKVRVAFQPVVLAR